MLLNVENISDLALWCGIAGTVIFVLKTFLPVDFGTEVGGDFTSITDTDASFHLLSIESIAAFFMCAGWMGWIAINQMHYSLKIAGLIAVGSGLLGMFLFVWIFLQFKKLEHTPKANLEELVNKTGKAYMNFAPKGFGKIQIEFNSKLETLDAKNNTDEEIKSFEAVKVVKIENNEIYIQKA